MKDEDIIKMLRNSEYLHEDNDYRSTGKTKKIVLLMIATIVIFSVLGEIISASL